MIYIRKNRDAIDYINEAADDAIIFHDLDDAIVGTNQHGELVYSYDKMHEVAGSKFSTPDAGIHHHLQQE
jgi:hypothetical protein